MQSTTGMKIVFTNLACKQAARSGFKPEAIQSTFTSPKKISQNAKFPDQFIVSGGGINLVGKPEGEKFVVITCFKKD